ncbi:50S ribosomal protein L32 [Candidatus Parcubacteria bacterium]|nr:MAG: 50S ribosomal protein L32 [Candidatus Parcubacteria bacterium]GIW69202.1 MAG: hypothetical protein KatS3mg100_696 [Candidatus Parcubacteria bacterium]
MVVRMRLTRSKTGMRRSHHKLQGPRLSRCVHCGAPHVRHTMCKNCGHYRKVMVQDIAVRAQKKQAAAKAKQNQNAS